MTIFASRLVTSVEEKAKRNGGKTRDDAAWREQTRFSQRKRGKTKNEQKEKGGAPTHETYLGADDRNGEQKHGDEDLGRHW